MFSPAPETFDERLLDFLVCGGGATEAMRAAAQEAMKRAVPVEVALLEGGLGLREILRGVIDVSNRHAISHAGMWIEQGLADHVPIATARQLGILPLAVARGRLYCLSASKKDAPGLQYGLDASTTEFLVLGFVADLEAELVALYAELDRVDPKGSSFLEYLLRTGVVHESHRASLEKSQHSIDALVTAAIRLGTPEPKAYGAAAAYTNRPFLTLSRLLALSTPELKPSVPRAYLEDVGVTLFHRFHHHLTATAVRVPNPTELARVMAASGCSSISTTVTTPTCFAAFLDHLYGPRDVTPETTSIESRSEVEELDPASSLADHPDIPNRFNTLLLDAVQNRASDIHIERYAGRVDVKYRIDGGLIRQDAPWLSTRNAQALVTKIKVDSRLDIAERRRPQDGVIRRRMGDRNVDFRVAIQPTLWGENVVLRILDQRRGSAPLLDDLGFSPTNLARFRRLAENPQGLVLLTGPTGCGKTTTLYSLLEELKRGDIKIMTAEDPVEYAIDGVQQSQVNEAIGNTFDHFLRAFLRQDPDVILIGEIRDAATAEMAIRAALTGHLVLSTLHVNDATGVVRRLTDLGISPNLVSQTLLCVLSQRLARRVCRACARPDSPPRELLTEFFPAGAPAGARFTMGQGCAACLGTGYMERLALLEFWELDDAARQLIERDATSGELLTQALASGMEPLVVDALDKAASGLTTLKELRNILPYDQIRRTSRQRAAPRLVVTEPRRASRTDPPQAH